MKEIAAQFYAIWKGLKSLQKLIALAILLFVSVTLGYLIFKSTGAVGGEKTLLLEEEELIDPGLSGGGQKGFELFDTNTWIKGDKELQVLEMRALKGQLEKDLAGFDQIKSARVIIDMAPGRSFGGERYKTKASVILTLASEDHLSISQLRAITNHLAGAVHGLEPNMIAISDTTGRLYKVLDPKGDEDFISNSALAFEEHLEQKITTLLTALVGEDHFVSSVQASVEKNMTQPSTLSIAVTIDQEYADLVDDIKNRLDVIALGYEVPFHLVVGAVSFEKKKGLWKETKQKAGYGGLALTLFIVLVALISFYPLFRKYTKQNHEESLFQVMTRIDINKLAESIEDEDPQTIALMLSYLEPARAEQLIAAFPEQLQEDILNNLSEFEYDNY